jgi:SAM-dependent methyltransferase
MSIDNFYNKFKIVSNFPLWKIYLRWVYNKTISDATKLNAPTVKQRGKPNCLLCGVSGEITAKEYIDFVLRSNKNADITIIDIGENQINSVKKIVEETFPESKILIKRADAVELSFIKDKSLDWIDTDGFFSYFDNDMLMRLFSEWRRVLKDDGYITFRELTSHNIVSKIANNTRDIFSRLYMNTKLHLHSLNQIEEIIEKAGFKFVRGISPIPFLDRYCLIKK